MKPTVQLCQSEDDYWRLRAFLRDVFLRNGRRERSWHVARLDFWRWHLIRNCQICGPVAEVTRFWETEDGQIAALLLPMVPGEVFLHVHPDFCCPELEDEILAQAEAHLTAPDPDGGRRLFVQAFRDDSLRRLILARRGYSPYGQPAHHWWRDLDTPLPEAPLAAGYCLRSMGDKAEYPARSWASWRAFHPDEPDEDYEGWDWYENIQAAPLYRRDLDVVAATARDEIAAFCTIWYDDATRSAVCVLVGTTPEHQRRGLGKAVMAEGLRRLQRLGGTRVLVNGHNSAANGLYGAVLGTADLSDTWLKQWYKGETG